MRTQDLERAIVQCKRFFVSPKHGRAVYEYDDLRAVLVSNKVDGMDKVTNRIMGRMIGGFGGFVLHQVTIGGKVISTVQAAPERIEALRRQVALYVDKPNKGPTNGMRPPSNLFSRHEKKARF
jgi:hypothetical protein